MDYQLMSWEQTLEFWGRNKSGKRKISDKITKMRQRRGGRSFPHPEPPSRIEFSITLICLTNFSSNILKVIKFVQSYLTNFDKFLEIFSKNFFGKFCSYTRTSGPQTLSGPLNRKSLHKLLHLCVISGYRIMFEDHSHYVLEPISKLGHQSL